MEKEFTIEGILFMSFSWAMIAGVLIFCFYKAFRKKKS